MYGLAQGEQIGLVGNSSKESAVGTGAMEIKNYTCSVCKYTTTYLTNYKRHMRRHTGQLFRCEVCGVQYNCRYYLQKHILRNHGSPAERDGSYTSQSLNSTNSSTTEHRQAEFQYALS